MQGKTCRCCKRETEYLWQGELLNKPVNYFECPHCGYVQTEYPTWFDRAYEDTINESDTGIMSRNLKNARIVLLVALLLGNLNGTVVDCAGGFGILVRLLRDYGINALWSDLYCQNLLARGFEYNGEAAFLATAFESFEHFVDPSHELEKLLSIAPNVLLSTNLVGDQVPEQNQWWYYGKEHGQHIGSFRLKTLKILAGNFGKEIVSDGRAYHLITDKTINTQTWKLALRLNKILAFLIKKTLASRTWSDHLKMSS